MISREHKTGPLVAAAQPARKCLMDDVKEMLSLVLCLHASPTLPLGGVNWELRGNGASDQLCLSFPICKMRTTIALCAESL